MGLKPESAHYRECLLCLKRLFDEKNYQISQLTARFKCQAWERTIAQRNANIYFALIPVKTPKRAITVVGWL